MKIQNQSFFTKQTFSQLAPRQKATSELYRLAKKLEEGYHFSTKRPNGDLITVTQRPYDSKPSLGLIDPWNAIITVFKNRNQKTGKAKEVQKLFFRQEYENSRPTIALRTRPKGTKSTYCKGSEISPEVLNQWNTLATRLLNGGL